jgi:glycosyltransferase involved in cell wall biosynthesis
MSVPPPSADELARLHVRLAARDAAISHWRQQHLLVDSLWTSAQQSRWWQLAAPLRALRQLVSPRGFDERALIPWQQLDVVPGAAAGTWVSSGPDPQFVVPCLVPAGWARVRLKMASQVWGRVEFFADTGDGFLGAECFERADCRGRLDLDFFTHFPRPIRGIRLDPLDRAGEFRLEGLRVDPVPVPRAVAQVLRNRIGAGRPQWQAVRDGLRWLFGRCAESLLQELPRASLVQPVGADMNAAYAAWRRGRALTVVERQRLRAAAAAMTSAPLLSLLMPLSGAGVAEIQDTLASVQRQLYPNWELLLAPCGSVPARLRNKLSDPRLRIVPTASADEAGALNAALAAAKGDYCAVLEPGDVLAEQALFRSAQALQESPDVDWLYSDEDQIDAAGRHFNPFFKPDWSPEYFLACMYTGRLGMYRTALVRSAGGFHSEYGDVVEYDLALRLLGRNARVRHLPEVLYHGRQRPGRTTATIRSTPAAADAGRRALHAYFHNTGRETAIEPGPAPGFQRVRPPIAGKPLVSIVITCPGWPLPDPAGYAVARCLDSIRARTTYGNYEVIVVRDPEIPEELQRLLAREGTVSVCYEPPFNRAAAANVGAAQARGDVLLFLQDDVEILTPGWVEALLEFALQPAAGAVGGRLLYPDGRLEHVGVVLLDGTPGHAFQGSAGDHPGYYFSNRVHRNCSAVSAACLMTRAEVFRSVQGFSEEFGRQYADVDYCLKVLHGGRRVVYTPYAELCHHAPVARLGTYADELQWLRQRWGRRGAVDPYYNPNLSQVYSDYRL